MIDFLKTLLFIIFLLGIITTHAQDKLYKLDNSKLEVKVLEIGPKEIKYKKWNNLEGPIYTVSKNDIIMILYQNGESEIINSPPTKESVAKETISPETKTPKETLIYGQNIFSFNPINLIFGGITFGYEHFNKADNFSFKIPVTIGYKFASGYGGFEFKFFPTKPGVARFFLGPAIKGGSSVLSYNGNNSNTLMGTILLMMGGSFQPAKQFNITIDGGVGPVHLRSGSSSATGILLEFGLHFGVRF